MERRVTFGAPMTPMVKRMLIVGGSIWLVLLIGIRHMQSESLAFLFSHTTLHPEWESAHSVLSGEIWQPLTYLFLHDLFSVWHVAMNGLILWFFGPLFEMRWGQRGFLQFFLLCGVGAGILSIPPALIAPDLFGGPILGASGAILGLIAAFGLLFPDRQIHLFFFLPIRGKHIIPITVGLDTLLFLTSPGSFAYATHLGGLATGYLLITGKWRPSHWIATLHSRTKNRKKKGRHLQVVPKDDHWIH